MPSQTLENGLYLTVLSGSGTLRRIMPKLSVDECRQILGVIADDKTDAEVEEWRDKLTAVANEMYDAMQSHLRNRPMDEVRWAAYMNEHPEEAADTRVGDEPNEHDLWAQYADDNPEDAL